MNNIIKTPLPWCLGVLALATALPLQAKWNAAGTDIKENGALTFATAQKDILVLYSSQPGAIKIKVNFPLTPKSTVEWKMVGLTTCVVGGAIADISGEAMVPYGEKYGDKIITATATYKASPTKANEYSTADAFPSSTTDDTRTLTRK